MVDSKKLPPPQLPAFHLRLPQVQAPTHMLTTTIRKISLPRLQSLYSPLLTTPPPKLTLHAIDLKSYRADKLCAHDPLPITRCDQHFLVIRDDQNNVVGNAHSLRLEAGHKMIGCRMPGSDIEVSSSLIFVESLYVKPEVRGQGLASSMLEKMIHHHCQHNTTHLCGDFSEDGLDLLGKFTTNSVAKANDHILCAELKHDLRQCVQLSATGNKKE